MNLRAIFILFLLTLQSCAQQSVVTAPAPAPEPEPPAATPPATPAKKATLPHVVVFVSDDIPAYSEVAKALAKLLGRRSTLVYLSGNQLEDSRTIAKYKNEDRIQVVSIGLSASLATKPLSGKQVVFCQVYNYQDYALLTNMHKGVSMLPSLSKTFSIWHDLSPATSNIGIITGPGFEDMINVAKAAASAHGITLHHQAVNSDKEYQYAYKQMHKKVQGYWLLPDNRVLSEHILRDVMTFSVRNSKQVAVFSDELLKLGGLFRTSSEYQDIAHQVYERLELAQNSDTLPGPDIAYLDKLNLRINPVMAHNLGLEIPKHYRKFANAP